MSATARAKTSSRTAPAVTVSRVSCRDLTIRLPIYGVDSRSLKKHLAKVRVGGRLGSAPGVTVVTALSGVNIELVAGDRLGLIGHNGSGKTTLLRALSGAYEPDEGQVEVVGRIASLLDLNIGIDASATGYDNIRLRGQIAGLTSAEIEDRMDDIADFTGLGPYLAMPVKAYSAGMQARLAFAAATAVDADIILMDEWLAVGDAEFKVLAHDRLEELVSQAGIVVMASHDRELLRLYCNKVARLEAGQASAVVDIDNLDELIDATSRTG